MKKWRHPNGFTFLFWLRTGRLKHPMAALVSPFSQLVEEALGDPGSQQRRAFRHLVSIASDPRTPSADLAAIWKDFRCYLPDRNLHRYRYLLIQFDGPLDYDAMSARQKRATHLLRTRHRPLATAIARNPKSHPDVLAGIAYYAPKALCANPILPGLLRSQPDWFQSLGGEKLGEEGNATIMRLLRCANAPRPLVEPFARGEFNDCSHKNLIPGEALRHIAITGESDETAWIKEVNAYWQEYVSSAPEDEKEEYREFAIAGLLPAWAYGETAEAQAAFREAREPFCRAVTPDISSEECTKLARNASSFAVRLAAIINPVTPEIERHRTEKEGIGNKRVGPMLQILRRHHTRKSVVAITAACHEVLQQAWQSHLSAFPLLEKFLWIRWNSRLLQDPAHSQEEGEYWISLLAWVVGVQPGVDGVWGNHESEGLHALARDGNRWVRAAAKARLHDSTVTLGW